MDAVSYSFPIQARMPQINECLVSNQRRQFQAPDNMAQTSQKLSLPSEVQVFQLDVCGQAGSLERFITMKKKGGVIKGREK
jgi:hypothetical protein